jgi:ferrous iron transport protein A
MTSTDAVLPLCQLPAGSAGRVRQLVGGVDFCQRIREMGLCESAFVAKIGGSGPFLCQINGTRIALSHSAAKCVMVEKLGRR